MHTVLLRSGYFMQNFSTMHRDDIRLRDAISLPSGRGRISMVDVQDVAQAAVAGLVDRDGCVTWDLTGPQALSTADVAATLTEVLGRPIHNLDPGILRFYREQVRHGTSRGLVLFMIAEYTHARLGFAGRLADGVRDALGREPTSLADFAQRERGAWTRGA